jgi:hypothetical protein
MALDSWMTRSPSTSVGTWWFGFTARYSGDRCSPWSSATCRSSYGSAASSSNATTRRADGDSGK